jgi:signal transduction histidine kinase/CheY-like chemotaxis protein
MRNLSIKRKLTLLAMLTSGIAVVLSSASFLVYDLVTFRTLLSQDLQTEAEIVAYNSAAAMAFNDIAAANVQLSSLTAKSDLVKAVLYDDHGSVFAHYSRPGELVTPAPPFTSNRPRYRFTGDHMEVYSDVALSGERLGTLFLQSDMRRWNTRARQYAGILAIFVLLSGLLSWVVSSRLQGLVSGPILDLEQTMRTVSSAKNYDVRAVKTSNDETGRLIDGFNTMLGEIQHRDKALQLANSDLRVRTQELEDEIFHRKRTQEELLKAKDAAEEASRAKSAFLANMSHELRTPLNAIIGYSEILEEETRESGPEQNVQDLRRIQTAGKHLLSLINDVLDLSKIEAGKMTIHLETCTLAPVIQEMVNTLKPAAERNRNRLTLHMADDIGAMHVDVTKLRQILFNLLSNACKFTENGTVALLVERRTIDGEERVVFQVTDTGIGMTAQQQRNLFQSFVQADNSTSRRYGGTGLGLAISRRFTQMMHGDIRVASITGKGSVFTVELPVHVPDEEPVDSTPPPGPLTSPARDEVSPASVHPSVVVIDDDPTARDLVRRLLERSEYQVACAANGKDGLRLVREIRPALITLDLVMPQMSGWDVLAELKSDPDLSTIPVVIVTMVDGNAGSAAPNAADVLLTPVDRDRLVSFDLG